MYNRFTTFALVLVLLSSFVLAADRVPAPLPAGTASGEPINLGKGFTYTWLKTDAAGKPAALGISISEAAIRSLPQEDQAIKLALPAGATYNEITLSWKSGKQAGFEVLADSQPVLSLGVGLFEKGFALKDKITNVAPSGELYPTAYSVAYDKSRKEYQIVLSEFQQR
jgi:hypothetical protein